MTVQATEAIDRKDLLDQRLMRAIFFGLAIIVALVAHHTSTERLSADPPQSGLLQETIVYIDGHPREGTIMRDADLELIAEFAPGEGGILETLSTVLRRQRLRHEVTADTPIVARLYEGGQLSLFDPTTRHSYNMTSYGSDNVAQIIDFLLESQ